MRRRGDRRHVRSSTPRSCRTPLSGSISSCRKLVWLGCPACPSASKASLPIAKPSQPTMARAAARLAHSATPRTAPRPMAGRRKGSTRPRRRAGGGDVAGRIRIGGEKRGNPLGFLALEPGIGKGGEIEEALGRIIGHFGRLGPQPQGPVFRALFVLFVGSAHRHDLLGIYEAAPAHIPATLRLKSFISFPF